MNPPVSRRNFLKALSAGSGVAMMPWLGGCSSSLGPAEMPEMLPEIDAGDCIRLLCFSNTNGNVFPHYSSVYPLQRQVFGQHASVDGDIDGQAGQAEGGKQEGEGVAVDEALVEETGLVGGYPQLAWLLQYAKGKNVGPSVVLDGGTSWYSGQETPEFMVNLLVRLSNALQVDYMCLGNELLLAPDRLKVLLRYFSGQALSSTLTVKDDVASDGESARKCLSKIMRYDIRRYRGTAVAFIALANHGLGYTSERFRSGAFEVGVQESMMQSLVQSLRKEQKVDRVVMLSQLGFWSDVKFADRIAGIDVIVSGGVAGGGYYRNGETVVIGCHQNLQSLVVVDVPFGEGVVKSTVLPIRGEITVGDRAALSLINKSVPQSLTAPIATVDYPLIRSAGFDSVDLLIAQAIGRYFSVETVVGVSANTSPAFLSKAALSLLDCRALCAGHNSHCFVATMTGFELLKILAEQAEHCFHHDPYQRFYPKPLTLFGLTASIDTFARSKKDRVRSMRIKNRKVIMKKKYRVAFWGFATNALSVSAQPQPLVDVVATYLQNGSPGYDYQNLPRYQKSIKAQYSMI